MVRARALTFTVLLAICSHAHAHDPNLGLMAAYSFEETSGTTTTDGSGSGNTGTISGATRTASGKVGRALSFDGINDRVNINDSASLDLTTGMTLEAWIYPTTLNYWSTVIMKEITGGEAYTLYAHSETPAPAGHAVTSAGFHGAVGNTPIPLNTWTHLASTYDGTTLRLYVNGVQAAAQIVSGAITTSTRPLRIGGNAIWGEYFQGRIDEVRIYNRALSAADIREDMAIGSGPPTLTITSPTNNSTIGSSTVNVTFTSAGDLTVANHARISLDGAPEQAIMALNGQMQVTGVQPGVHTLSGHLARADGTKIIGSDASPITFTVAAPGPTPRLSFSTPANNSTLSPGPVSVTFATTGDLAEANHVHIRVDGGPDLMVMALTGSAEIQDLAPGAHRLEGYVVRSNHSKIEGSDATPVDFTISGGAGSDPAVVGQWASQIIQLPTVAVNHSLLHTGKTIFWAGDFASAPNYGELWNPANNQITPVPNPFANIFCSAHVHLADGRLLVAGGHDKQNGIMGLAQASTFNPVTETWTSLPNMAYRRWYPTLTLMGDGRAIVTSGSETTETAFVEIPEIYDPVANTWTPLVNARRSIPQYPMMFALPDGRLLQAGSTEHPTNTLALNVATQQWTVVDSRVFDGGSGVMYAPGKILKSGSGSNDGQTPTAASAATTYVLDMTQPSPAWRQTAPMQFARTFHNLTSLADGTVLVTSGSGRKSETNVAAAVLQAEIWSPETETWTTLSSMQTPRIYHSTALLLPDARVAVAGSGNIAGAPDQTSIEIFSPPYLFKGSRPVISGAPDQLQYATTFSVQTPNATTIKAVNLVRLGADTHNFDQDQRFVPLTFAKVAGGLEVQSPANSNLATPGHYMLFLVSDAGVPSVAKIVRFPAPYEDLQAPTAPTALVAIAGVGSVALSWQASSDNVGINRYEIHRSTSATFVPSSGTRIGQLSAASFTDTGLANGTYYYAVVAVDAAGNTSSPSNVVSATVSADTTAPAVSLTAPASGASVSGTVAVTAAASDNVGVAGVQFRLDGVALGPEDTAAPFTYAWNSSSATNGAHVLTAIARDSANNTTTSAPINVTVANTAPPTPTGLVAAYSFEETSGTTTADGSGSGNTGTISGATRTASGKVGRALSFDGVNDRVNINDSASLDLTTGMTLEAWIYPTTLNSWSTVIMKEIAGGEVYTLYANGEQPRPSGHVTTPAGLQEAVGTAPLPINAWTHLASTYDGTTLRLYVNGAQVASHAASGAIRTSSQALRIGGNAIWGEYFAGRIDEVRIYNRALTAAEILAAMTPASSGPRLTITAPANNATITQTAVNVTFSSSGDVSQAAQARFRLDGGPEIPVSSLNGQFTLQSVAPGTHTLEGYLARADQSKINDSDAVPVQFTVTLPDTVPPTVVLSAPRDGDTVTGNVTLTAQASDDRGVAGVQFRLNGTPLGAEDTSAPFTLNWSTASVSNGTHVLTAVARDAAGNSRLSLAVNVVVINATAPQPAGLVAAYGFEQGSGTVAADSSGNSNNGAISGAVWDASGRFGRALRFDGVNDIVNIPDAASLDLTTGMTLEAWVYPTTLNYWSTVIMKEITGGEAYTLYAHSETPRPSGHVVTSSGFNAAIGSAPIPVNTWTHLAATYDGTQLRLYVNGVQTAAQGVTGAITTSTRPLRIGGNTIWGEYFSGMIDEVRVYNRALSIAELQARMNVPVVSGSGVEPQPTRSSPIVVDSVARRVWVVNPDSDTITALHADTLVKVFEINVGKRPSSVALDAFDQVWVACRDDDSLWVLDATSGAMRQVLTMARGSAPSSVVFTPDRTTGYVGLEGSASIQRIAAQTRVLGPTVALSSSPSALAITKDATRLLATRFRSPDTGGEVGVISLASFASSVTLTMPVDTTAVDGSLAARGIPNYLVGLAIDPADGLAWVVGKKDNLLRGLQRDGRPLTFETSIRALVGRLDLRANAEQVERRIDLNDSSQPSAIALGNSGALAFVTLQGNNRIVVLNQLGAEIARAETGLAPQGVAIDFATNRVFTQDLMSRTVTVFDGTRVMTQGIADLPPLAQISTVATEKLNPTVLRGKQIFYNAADTRMSRDGYLSCASCHLDGGQDGRVWDFTDRGEGLRNTTSLRGGAGNALAPLHWTGNFDEVQDFEGDIRVFFGGTGFMSDADYAVGTRSQPLGQPKAGVSSDLDALAAYVNSLSNPGLSPYRQASGALTSGAVAGQARFNSLGCQACHSGPRFSDSATGVRHNVGTIKPGSGGRAGAPLDGFDTPTLLGLWATAPHLHDGSAASVRDVLTTANPASQHGNLTGLTPTEIDQLVEYLLQLESQAQ